MYYNNQKGEYKLLKEDVVVDENYIENNNEYTEKLLDVSNKTIVFDLLNPNSEEETINNKE